MGSKSGTVPPEQLPYVALVEAHDDGRGWKCKYYKGHVEGTVFKQSTACGICKMLQVASSSIDAGLMPA